MGVRRSLLAGLIAAELLASAPTQAGPSEACLEAAREAEQRWGLPTNLLRAIGAVETGRADGQTGRLEPWPWSANAGGAPYVFASAAEARAVVGFLRERGIASIDVGCFQVNLHFHPAAFASTAQGFEPETNADYAGRFLRSLFERSGSWTAAIGAYHSENPGLGAEYRAKVLRAWHGLSAMTPSRSPPDPHVIRVTPAAVVIPVYTPATLPPALSAALRMSFTKTTARPLSRNN